MTTNSNGTETDAEKERQVREQGWFLTFFTVWVFSVLYVGMFVFHPQPPLPEIINPLLWIMILAGCCCLGAIPYIGLLKAVYYFDL